MERLSNSSLDLMSQVRLELDPIGYKSKNILICYSEFPLLPGGQFCISVIDDKNSNQLRAIKQEWDNEYDLNRFLSGVYNLDRLCIKKSETELSKSRENELNHIVKSIAHFPDTLNDESCFTLDGSDYKLILSTESLYKEYQWRVATDKIIHFESLILFLLAIDFDK